MKKVLFAVPERLDPFLSGDECNEGAILRFLRKRSFDKIVLLDFPGYRLNVMLTKQAIAAQFSWKTVQSYALDIPSLSYKAVFNGLREVLEVNTVELQTEDCLTFLLPYAAEDPILDCLLLSALSLPRKVEVCRAERPANAWVQQAFQTEEDAFEWHDVATDEHANATFLSSEQLDFLYRTWDQNKAFCLKTRDTEQQEAVARAMRLYSQMSGSPYREVACADIPEHVATELLWGYKAEVDGKMIARDGLLTKQNVGVSLLGWDAFSEALKSNTVAFLSKSNHRFMALSNTEDALSQIPTYVLPN